MSANAAEWVMALGAVATGIFVGWQSFLLNQSISSPFEANLQARQIDACARFIREYGKFSSGEKAKEKLKEYISADINRVIEENEKENKTRKDVNDLMDEEMWIESDKILPDKFNFLIGNIDVTRGDVIWDVGRDLRASLEEIKIYSGADFKRQVLIAEKAIPVFGLDRKFKIEDSSVERDSIDLESATKPIRDRCRLIMLGEEKGLL